MGAGLAATGKATRGRRQFGLSVGIVQHWERDSAVRDQTIRVPLRVIGAHARETLRGGRHHDQQIHLSGAGEYLADHLDLMPWVPGHPLRAGFTAKASRYHLCPPLIRRWASRMLLSRKQKVPHAEISVSVVLPKLADQGRRSGDREDPDRDDVNGATFLHDTCTRADPRFMGGRWCWCCGTGSATPLRRTDPPRSPACSTPASARWRMGRLPPTLVRRPGGSAHSPRKTPSHSSPDELRSSMVAATGSRLVAACALVLGLLIAGPAHAQRADPPRGGDDFAANEVPPRLRPGQRGSGPPVPIEVRLRIFIPAPLVSLVNILGQPDLYNLGCMTTRIVNFDTCLFHGDGRGFSYASGTQRAFVNVVLLPGGGAREHFYYCRTHEYRPDQGRPVSGKPWWWFERRPGARPIDHGRLQVDPRRERFEVTSQAHPLDPGRLRVDPRREGTEITNYLNYMSTVDIRIRGANPLVFGPPIDAQFRIYLYYQPGYRMTAKVVGSHDYFPAYELYVNGQRMTGKGLPYNPADTLLASPYSLLGSVLPRQTVDVPATEIPGTFPGTLPAITADCR